jgi:hypothetical protein
MNSGPLYSNTYPTYKHHNNIKAIHGQKTNLVDCFSRYLTSKNYLYTLTSWMMYKTSMYSFFKMLFANRNSMVKNACKMVGSLLWETSALHNRQAIARWMYIFIFECFALLDLAEFIRKVHHVIGLMGYLHVSCNQQKTRWQIQAIFGAIHGLYDKSSFFLGGSWVLVLCCSGCFVVIVKLFCYPTL